MKFKQLILITGVERSGSTLISRVLQLCEANAGQTNKMRENNVLVDLMKQQLSLPSLSSVNSPFSCTTHIPENWKELVAEGLQNQNIPESMPFLLKSSLVTRTWKIWHEHYPTAKWIIVRRRTGDIVNSLIETAHMNLFKNENNRKLINAETEKEAWIWWIHQYEDVLRDLVSVENLDYRIVWPERMRDGDFTQMKEVVSWCDLKWNDEVVDLMQNLLKTKP